MSKPIEFESIDEEVQTPVEDLRIVQTDIDGSAEVESDDHRSTPPTGRDSRTEGGAGADFGSLLGGMDAEELEELTQRIAHGEVTVTADDRPGAAEAADFSAESIGDPTEDEADEPAAEEDPEIVEDEEEADDPASTEDKTGSRARIRVVSDEDAAVVAYMKEHPGTGIAAALGAVREAAETVADEFDAPEPKPKTTASPGAADLPFETAAAAEDRILELEDARDKAAYEDYDDAEAKRLSDEIRQLRRQMPQIRAAEADARAAEARSAQETYEQEFDRSKARAESLWPELKDPESALFLEVARLDREAKAKDPALFDDPRKYQILAEEAVISLRRAGKPAASAPSRSSTSVPTRTATPSRVPAAKGVSSPTTGRGRATPTAPAASGLGGRVETMDLDDLAELDAQMGFR